MLFLYAPQDVSAASGDLSVTTLSAIPPGVTLPVSISRSLRAGKVKVGTSVSLETTQRVPVAPHLYLKAGAKVRGEIVASQAANTARRTPPSLSIRFTALEYGHQSVPLSARAVAVANFTDVGDTFLPAMGGPDRGNSSQASLTTTQVGGDEVYRSGWVGDVCDRVMRKVGYADYNGVYALPRMTSSDAVEALPRAVGVFSTTAQGLYGFDDASTLSFCDGIVTLVGGGKSLVVRNGDNFLLEVVTSK